MARPRPTPENEPSRTTISLPTKVTVAGERYMTGHPRAEIKDFSGLVSLALVEYLDRHHPGLIEAVVAELRTGATPGAKEELRAVAEDAGEYVAKGKPGPSVDDLVAGEQKRRRRTGQGRGGGPKRGARPKIENGS